MAPVSLGAMVDPNDVVIRTFDVGDELLVRFPEPGAAGAGARAALAFGSDANNMREYSGFRLAYAPIFEDETYCDELWPCGEDQSCEDGTCAAAKSSDNGKKSNKRLRRRLAVGAIVAACALMLCGLVAMVGSARRVVRAKEKLEFERASIIRGQVLDARQGILDFQAPFCVVRADAFGSLGELKTHEALRDGRGTPKGRAATIGNPLEFYDSAGDVAQARARGVVFVFLSHQWLGHLRPDPRRVHYKSMCRALRSAAEDACVPLGAVRAWVDVCSIPQAPRGVRGSSRRPPRSQTRRTPAPRPWRSPRCPSSRRALTTSWSSRPMRSTETRATSATRGRTASGLGAARRSSRAGHGAARTACSCRRTAASGRSSRRRPAPSRPPRGRRGPRPAWSSAWTSSAASSPAAAPGRADCSSTRVDDACLGLGHPDGQPCDREALVAPMLGLLAELYRDRRARPQAWALISGRLDELYPRNFRYSTEGKAAVGGRRGS